MLVVGNLFRSGLFCVDFCQLFRRLISEISKAFFAVFSRSFAIFTQIFLVFFDNISQICPDWFAVFKRIFLVFFRSFLRSFSQFCSQFLLVFSKFYLRFFANSEFIFSGDWTKAKFASVDSQLSIS